MVLDLHALPTFHSFEAQYLEKVGTNSLPFQCPFFLQMDQASLDTPTKENTHKYEHYRVIELKLKKKNNGLQSTLLQTNGKSSCSFVGSLRDNRPSTFSSA